MIDDPEFVCISEEDYDEMCMDISFFSTLAEMLNEKLAENGIAAVIDEEEIWKRVRSEESGTEDLN